MVAEVDTAQHLPLIHRVIKQLNLYGDMKEEAFSEGLVLITEAAKSYDPSREVPLANWLAKNIRWGLATWITKQKATVELPATMPLEGAQRALSARTELTLLLARMQELLTPQERAVILYSAAGYKGIELAKLTGLTPVRISNIKKAAQRKLQEDNNLLVG